MKVTDQAEINWVQDLVTFLREQPSISAVRIDAGARTVAVATIGPVDIADFEARLAETISSVETQLSAQTAGRVPAGFLIDALGAALVGQGL